jgi:hypothetical protein
VQQHESETSVLQNINETIAVDLPEFQQQTENFPSSVIVISGTICSHKSVSNCAVPLIRHYRKCMHN